MIKPRRAVLLLFCSSAFLDAQVYHCKDQYGETIFSDSECEDDQKLVETLDIPVVETTPNSGSGLAASNLVLNAGFEDGEEQWIAEDQVTWEPSLGKYASAAISIHAEKPLNNKYTYEETVEQCIPLDGGDRYMWSAEVRLDGYPETPSANRANAIWYRSADCSSGGQWAAYREPKSVAGWQKLRGRPMLPAMGAKAVKLTLVQNGRSSNGGTAYWDNIEFYSLGHPDRKPSEIFADEPIELGVVEPGLNLIQNGEFSQDLDGWDIVTRAVWAPIVGKDGSGSVRTTVASNKGGLGVTVLSQCVKLAK